MKISSLGRRIFGRRLYVCLAAAVAGCELLEPRPFLDKTHLPGQFVSLVIIAAGVWLRAWASGCAGAHTRDPDIHAPRLVTAGPFAHVRNPIYLGTILIGVGMSGLIGDPLAFVLTGLVLGFLYFALVPAEEEFLRSRFGEAYARYQNAVPRWVPRLHPWQQGGETAFDWRAARGEIPIILILTAIYLGLHLEEYLDTVFWWA